MVHSSTIEILLNKGMVHFPVRPMKSEDPVPAHKGLNKIFQLVHKILCHKYRLPKFIEYQKYSEIRLVGQSA